MGRAEIDSLAYISESCSKQNSICAAILVHMKLYIINGQEVIAEVI